MAQQIDIVANLLMKVDGAEAGINKLKSSLSKLKLPEGLENSFKKSFSNLDTIFAKYRSQVEKGFDTKSDVSAFNKTSKALDTELTRLSKHFTELTGQEINFKVKSDDIIRTEKELERLVEQKVQLSKESLKFEIKGGKDGFKDIESILLKLKDAAGKTKTGENIGSALDFLKIGNVQSAISLLEKASISVKRFKQEKQDAFKSETGFDMSGILTTMISLLGGAEGKFSDVNAKISETKNNLTNFQAEQIQKAGNYAEELSSKMENNASTIRQADGAMQEFARSSQSMSQQLGDLQQSTQYFFSLRNMINLFKRGVDDAIQSVKELDAAMTETAVVTDYKVSDLWGMLPEYTQLANQLGATTQGAYETMTLYFQQGLDQQQAFEIGAETMKMARIAGLDYAETTDMMTAALRGFNMELNETSAKRINDVYSELAAITASDTEELGTAMQRTASIAHSAGMSFEGTTAFLAQAIETTREPAENIGTAMKTIVARFQEMKKNPLEISEVDGEEVNYNKVDAALQSIGVSLKDTNGQFRELDQVFLDISSRWDSLSQTQQRYIATIAAGSRQQSRFIAMMDNYDRTVQLFEAANNSAGASDEQFGKTMDSLESKLNKLHNAWQAFTMGIANNGMIKLAVDGLTGFLTVTNKIINTLSLGSGALKSFLSIFAAFTGLKTAGKVANGLIGGLGGLIDPQSSFFKGFFGGGAIGDKATKNAAQARAISDPIVQSIHQLQAALTGTSVTNKGQNNNINNSSGALFKQINGSIRQALNTNKLTGSGLMKQLGGLDKTNQRLMMANLTGTQRNLNKNLLNQYDNSIFKQSMPAIHKAFERIDNQVANESIAFTDGYAAKVSPKELLKHLDISNADEKALAQSIATGLNNARQTALEKAVIERGKRTNPDFSYDDPKRLADAVRAFANTDEGKRVTEQAEVSFIKDPDIIRTPLQQTMDNLGKFGAGITGAGVAISTFGNVLTSTGIPGVQQFGTMLSTIGSGISSLGTALSGAAMAISTYAEVVKGSSIAQSAVAFITNPLTIAAGAVAAALAGLAIVIKLHNKQIKKEAEEVSSTYKDKTSKANENIGTLKQYREELAVLSKGVDENGLNVSLDTSDYERYQEIVKSIAEINPDIVKGYNAQGQAIIDNNRALEETLKIQQKNLKQAQQEYTSKGSLQKLINARNLDETFNVTKKGETGFRGDVFAIADQLRLIKDFDESSLHKYGVESLDALLNGEEEAVKNFTKHRDKIQNDLANSGIELSDDLIKGFEKLDTDQKAFDEAIQPVYDNLLASVSNSPFYEEMGSEFKSAIASGLKDIASQDLNASEMQSQANLLVQEFDNLTHEGSRYATAMEQVESAQDKFASSLDVSEYAKNTEGALSTLNSLLKEYEGNTTAYGQAVTEYLTNQIEKIKNFTEEGSTSLTEALNGMTNTISAAEGAYDSFQESTKTDFSTGAQSMKSIFEEVTKETDGVMLHMEKFGDATMWKGARALLGDEFVEKNGENVELVKKELLSLKSELQDGEKGFTAFWNNFKKVDDSKIEGFTWNEDGSYDINRDINPDAYKEIAEQMHRSEEYVVSMLNKGRQFADIDFTNIDDVRKALSTDSGAIAGTSTTGGERDLYVKKDYLQNAMSEAGIVNPSEQAKETKKLLAKGIKVIPNANDITKDDFKSMGITDLPSLVQKLGDTGQFNRSEIEEYAQQLEGEGYNAKELDTVYDDYLSSQEHPELPSLNSIESNVQTIASILGSNRVEQGYADENTIQAYEEAKKAVNGENGHNKGEADSISELFALGKNREHEKLSESEYQSTLKLLDKQIDEYTRASQVYEKGAEKAEQEGRDFDAKELLKEAHGYAELAKRLEEDKTKGEQVHQNLQDAEESTKQKAPGMSSDVNQILDKQRQDRELQEAAEQKRSEALAKQTEEYNKQKKAQEEAEKVRAQGLAEQTKQYNQQKEEQKKAQEEAEKVRAQGLVKQTEEINKQKESEQIAENAVNNTAQGAQKSGEYITGVIANSLAGGIQEEANKTDGAAYSGIKKINPGSILGSILEKIWPNSDDLKFENTDTNTWGTRNLNNSRENLWNSLIEGWDSLFGAEDSIPEEEDTSFVSKVESSAQKLGEALKKGWDALHQNTPPEPTTSTQPSSPTQTASTVSQGGNVVAGVAQEVVQKVTTQESGLDETQQKLNTISSTASQGAEMKVSTADSAVQSTLTAIRGLQSVANKGVSVKTTTTSGGGTDQIKNAAAKGADMPIRVNDQATPKIKSIEAQAKKPVSKTVNISPHFTGSWQHSVYLSATGPGARYTGQNNKISYHHIPLAGSAARGTKKGRVGPRGQGGLTLTGEMGYEIAWLPSENRSMILGASGPEMINLPKDAVIYNHDQSKEIMKRRQGIFAGSMDSGSYDGGSSSPSNGSNKSSKSSKATAKNNKQSAKNNKNAEKVVDKAARVSVWWENMTRRIDATQRKVDKTASKFEKIIKSSGGATRAQADAAAKGYADNLNKVIKLSQEEITKATNELKTLDTGAGAKKQKGLKKLYNAGAENITQISYTKGKKSKNEYVNLAGYIKAQDGTYVVDQAALNRISNVEKRKAVADAANKEIDDRIQKLNKAEDAIQKAQEALEKLADDTYEAFDQWDKTITQVYLLGQRLEQLTKQKNVYEAAFDSEVSRLTAGFGTANNSLGHIISALDQNQKLMLAQVNGQTRLIQDAFAEYRDIVDLDTYYKKTVRSNPNSQQAKNDYAMIAETLKFLQEIGLSSINNFDYTQAVQRLEGKRYNESSYNKIKEGLDKIKDKQDAYYSSIEETYKTVGDIYGVIDEYKSFIADFEQELLSGIEEQTKNEIDHLDKLNSALSKAYKDLLDEVKRKLDEHRQQEDNIKTETDISQKQQRLTMLRADTSGGHAVEIAQLEKELAEARQNYERSLEDQLLEKLQHQADVAEEQRQRQIELLEGQNQIAQIMGTNLEDVKRWLQDPQANYEQLRQAYFAAKKYEEATPGEQEKISNEFESGLGKYLAYLIQLDTLKTIDGTLTEALDKADESAGIVRATYDEIQQIKSTQSSLQTSIVEPGVVTTSKTEQADKAAKAASVPAPAPAPKPAPAPAVSNKETAYRNTLAAIRKKGDKFTYADVNRLQDAANAAGHHARTFVPALIAGDGPPTWKHFLTVVKGHWSKERLAASFGNNKNFVNAFNKVYGSNAYKKTKKGTPYAYKTGGLNTYTGPAWLDGTPSKPELVLNSTDTKNFIALKDVLSRAINSTDHVDKLYGGNATYEININVDHLNNDYDVDKVVERVKKKIVQDSSYRNVTQVRNFR